MECSSCKIRPAVVFGLCISCNKIISDVLPVKVWSQNRAVDVWANQEQTRLFLSYVGK